ncbi:MAG: enoyl-CoA hydratase/isomerase family protein [Chloroflexi bacterium]|nr:enoyl-CoA hydratase/isomerase family protein [Chloroflexota bacterium]
MQYVKYEEPEPYIVVISMDRPERLNAWGSRMLADLEEAFCRFDDDPQARVAVLRGEGRAFCAGADVKEWAETGQPRLAPPGRRVFTSDWGTPELRKPVVAAVHGYCLGAGLNLCLLRCDIRIAGEGTKFGMPEVARGILDLATPFGYQNIPYCFIAELCFTADMVSAERAHHFGLVNMVVPDAQVLPTAMDVARRIARHPPSAIQFTKANLLKTLEPPAAAFPYEQYLRQQSFYSPEAREGMRAWVERQERRGSGA